MGNYELLADEVILYENVVRCKVHRGNLQLTLTSKKIVLEKEKGLLKKEREVVDTIPLESIKKYQEAAQISQKGTEVNIQAIEENLVLEFANKLEARKFAGKAIDAATGTTFAQRGSGKVQGAFGLIDETLGLDTRETVKGFLDHGVKGVIFGGIGKKK